MKPYIEARIDRLERLTCELAAPLAHEGWTLEVNWDSEDQQFFAEIQRQQSYSDGEWDETHREELTLPAGCCLCAIPFIAEDRIRAIMEAAS